MKKYVVAGATGRVGSIVVRELLARGEAPTLVLRDRTRGAEWSRRGVDAAVGSLDDSAFLARTLRGADGMFVLLPENVNPDDFHGARRRMADAVASAVRESGVPHVVLLSAIAAVLPEGNGPAKGLHYFEAQLRRSGARLSALRACYFQDNVAGALQAAAQAGIYPNLLTSADEAIPMIATEDVGRFAAEALTAPPHASEIVDLLGPRYSARQLAERLAHALGRAVQVVTIPAEGHVAALADAGVPRAIAEAVAEMFAAFNAGKLVPSGDRRLEGTSPIEATIARCLRAQRAA
jgi:uncharacterized protein YbjT (DUF2867 family)